ncbi:nucleotidyltransferase family protein [Microbacterium sp. SLBN-111]|uniref:nucleotidyltransferase family protein n=1 Tax=Microbacterium sp. SLBN-111 TaxID=3377733 RepID=UPI003C74C293
MTARSRRASTADGQATADAFVEVPQRAAVSLLAPVVQAFADRHGIRILGIKGQALALQGLRTARSTGDVDMLVDPSRFDELCALLRHHRWRDRDGKILVPLPPEGSASVPHARTLEHPHWPTHLDLHRYYPGFLGPAQETFEFLWDARDRVGDGTLSLEVPARIDHWLLAALHAIRSGDERQMTDLRERAQAEFAGRMSTVLERGIELRAFEPLRGQFLLLGEQGPAPANVEPPLLTAWNRRLRDSRADDDAFVEQLLDARGRVRMALLLRQIFPPPRSARAFHAVAPGPLGLLAFYARRLLSGPRYGVQYARIVGRRWVS